MVLISYRQSQAMINLCKYCPKFMLTKSISFYYHYYSSSRMPCLRTHPDKHIYAYMLLLIYNLARQENRGYALFLKIAGLLL